MYIRSPARHRSWARVILGAPNMAGHIRELFFLPYSISAETIVADIQETQAIVEQALRMCVNLVELRPPSCITIRNIENMPFRLTTLHGPVSHLSVEHLSVFILSQPSIRRWIEANPEIISDKGLDSVRMHTSGLDAISMYAETLDVTNISFQAIRRLRIMCSRKGITPSEILAIFPNKQRLTHVDIQCRAMTRDFNISASGLRDALANLTELRYLKILFMCPITQQSITEEMEPIHSLQNLEILVLGIQLGSEDRFDLMHSLRLALPKLNIVQFDGCYKTAYDISFHGFEQRQSLVHEESWLELP